MSFFGKKKKGNLLSDPEDAHSARSSQQQQQHQQPHRGQPLPSPSPTNSDPSASPTAPLLSSSQRRGTTNYAPEPVAQYSAVGGDGAIGGLEWTEEDQPLQPQPTPYSHPHAPAAHEAQLSVAPAASPAAIVDHLTPSPEIVVPTLGQVDQLTEAQEASIRQAQHEQATAIHGYADPTPIEAVVDADTEWNDRTFVRTRSTVDQSLLPPPRHMSTSSSAGVAVAPSAAAPTPLLSSKLSPVHSRSSSSDAASIPGHRGSTISAFGALAPAGAGAHSAAMVPGHSAARGSNPSSRRSSLSGDSLHPTGEGLAQHSRRKSSAGPSTPVLGAAPAPAAIPPSPSTIAAASTPGPAASPIPPAAAVVAVQPQPATSGAGLATGSDSGVPAVSNNAQPPAPAARVLSLPLAPSSGIPRDLPGGSSGAATLVNPRPFPKGLVRPSVHGPAASMSWAIGRAAGEEVKRVVKKDGSGNSSSSSNASPGYTAYMNAINEATAAQAAGVAVGAAAVGAGVAVAAASSSSSSADGAAAAPRRSTVTAANLGPPSAMLKPGPPLPPRTHARQRTSSVVGVDLRRASTTADPSPDHMESAHGTTEEDLIPLSPSVHLLMSSYMLLYLSLASMMPAWLAMMMPLALYAAVGHVWPAMHEITHHRKPRVQQMGKQRSASGGAGTKSFTTASSSSVSGVGVTNPALVAAAQSLPKPAEPPK